MRTLSLIAGVLVIGCMVCTVDEEPEVLEFEGSAYVRVSGELNGESNMPTGQLMLGLAKGLTDGNCWSDDKPTYGHIVGAWMPKHTFSIYPECLVWSEYYGDISYTGGNGSCDSVIYVSTTKQWPYSWLNGFELWEADLYRCIGYPIIDCIPLAEQEPHGSLGDSVMYGDYVQISWELTAHVIDVAGEGNFGTAQLAYDLAYGMRHDDMPYGLYIDFYYNNADTSRRTVSTGTWARTDTTEVRALFTAQDTLRDTADDSLYGIDLVNSRGDVIARDTVDRFTYTNKAVKWIETIYLVRWPGGTP